MSRDLEDTLDPGPPRATGWAGWSEKRRVLTELLTLYFVTLFAIRLVVSLVEGLGLWEVLYAASRLLFMYAPVWACRWRGADPWDYPMALPSLRDAAPWREAFGWLVLLGKANRAAMIKPAISPKSPATKYARRGERVGRAERAQAGW